MDTRYLSVDNLREFSARWPDAEAFLTRCSLKNERSLLSHYWETLNEWQKARLAELDELHERQEKMQGEG
jgi:predicted  nucleic acid-binding Zn-ribbon protein